MKTFMLGLLTVSTLYFGDVIQKCGIEGTYGMGKSCRRTRHHHLLICIMFSFEEVNSGRFKYALKK